MKITKTNLPKPKPASETLGFGEIYADHMVVMDYYDNKWHEPAIVPYAPLEMQPSSIVFHYGQAVFEGLKAYRSPDDKILLFRPMQNVKRLNSSNRRMCIPEIDEQTVLDAMIKLVDLDRDWVPNADGTSLYIRPFVIAMDVNLGVRPSSTYKLMIINSPSRMYHAGFNTVKIKVEEQQVRATPGGTGSVKAAANYAVSLAAQASARDEGCAQVLWLDANERKYVEEVGTMNVFFVIDCEVVTPALTDTILPGITRDSAIIVLRSMGYNVSERKVTLDEVITAAKNGRLTESFGTGTAVVISPIGCIRYKGEDIQIADNKIGAVAQKLYDRLTGIQYGKIADEFNWVVEV